MRQDFEKTDWERRQLVAGTVFKQKGGRTVAEIREDADGVEVMYLRKEDNVESECLLGAADVVGSE